MPAKFTCKHCGKTFSANYTLRRHVRQCHPDSPLPEIQRGRKRCNVGACVITCSQCDQHLVNSRAQFYHMWRFHHARPSVRRHERERRTLDFDNIRGMLNSHQVTVTFLCYNLHHQSCHPPRSPLTRLRASVSLFCSVSNNYITLSPLLSVLSQA